MLLWLGCQDMPRLERGQNLNISLLFFHNMRLSLKQTIKNRENACGVGQSGSFSFSTSIMSLIERISSLILSISFLRLITSNRRDTLPYLTNWLTFSAIVCSLISSPTLSDNSFKRSSLVFILIGIRLDLRMIRIMKARSLSKIPWKNQLFFCRSRAQTQWSTLSSPHRPRIFSKLFRLRSCL